MMAQSVSWSDPTAIAALLERASKPSGKPERSNRFDYRRRSPTRQGEFTKSVRSVSGPPKPEAKPEAPAIEHTSDTPTDRLDALVAWTIKHFQCDGAFVADDRGLTLATHGVEEADISLIGPWLSALDTVRTIPGVDARAGALRLGTRMMSWVEVTTARGEFCLGIVGAEAAPIPTLRRFQEALETTFQGI